MKLILTNAYPHPCPEDFNSDEWCETEEHHKNLTIEGVVQFEMKHTLTVGFENYQACAKAASLTGWSIWSWPLDILEAGCSEEDGYGPFPAVIVKDRAYCGVVIVGDEDGL